MTKSIKIPLYVWALVLFVLMASSEARAGTMANSILNTCDCTGTGDIFVDVQGNSTSTGYVTEVYLLDASGNIVAGPLAAPATFAGTTTGAYTVYVINYDSNDAATVTAVGALATEADIINLPNVGCADFDSIAASVDDLSCNCPCSSVLNVCPCEGDANVLDVNVQGNNTTLETWYIALGDGPGGCTANMTGDFSGLPDDTYSIYVVNVDPSDANYAAIAAAVAACDITTINDAITAGDCVDIDGPVAGSVNGPNCNCTTCTITDVAVTNIVCSDPGTPNDASDDTFTFDVVVTATDGDASGWSADDANSTTGTYGATVAFGPYLITGGQLNFTVTDNGDPSCTFPVTVNPPASCSAGVCESVLNVCDCANPTGDLEINVEGNFTGDPNYSTVVFVVDNATGIITAVGGSGAFPAIPTGTYDVYVVNYDTTDPAAAAAIAALTAGAPWADPTGLGCLDVESLIGGASVNAASCGCTACLVPTNASGAFVFCADDTDLDLSLGGASGVDVASDPDATYAGIEWYVQGDTPGVDAPYAGPGTTTAADNCNSGSVILLAYLLCDENADGFSGGADDSYIAAGSITVTVYPDISQQVNTVVNDGGCCPVLQLECPTDYQISHDYNGGGTGNPDCSNESGIGNFTFTVTFTGTDAGQLTATPCLSATYPASYDCFNPSCPTPTIASGTFVFCEDDADLDLALNGATGIGILSDPDATYGGLEWYISGDTPGVDAPYTAGSSGTVNNCDVNTLNLEAYIICTLDGSYIPAGNIVVRIYPNVADQNNVVLNDGACCPVLQLECPTGYVLEHDYNGGGFGNPSCTGETGIGAFSFTVSLNPTNPDAAFLAGTGCISESYPVNYDCTCDLDILVIELNDGNTGGTGPFYYNTVEVDIFNGTEPYTYEWDAVGYVRNALINQDDNTPWPDGDREIRVDYSDNAYWSVTVTDNQGCQVIATNDPSSGVEGMQEVIDIAEHEIEGDNCNTRGLGEGEGSITIFTEHGTPPYQYEWTGPITWQNGGPIMYPYGSGIPWNGADYGPGEEFILEDLPYGWYAVTVTDSGIDDFADPRYFDADGNPIIDDDPGTPLPQQITEGWYWVECERPSGRGKVDLGDADVAAVPNPFSDITNLMFSTPETANVSLELFTITGQQVLRLFDGELEGGIVHEITFEAGPIPAGVYMVKLTSVNGHVAHTKIVINKGDN